MESKKLHLKISALILTTMAVIASMSAILVHERQRMREIETETGEIQEIRSDINAAQRSIITLATLGEGIIGWEEADYLHYRTRRPVPADMLSAGHEYKDLQSALYLPPISGL